MLKDILNFFKYYYIIINVKLKNPSPHPQIILSQSKEKATLHISDEQSNCLMIWPVFLSHKIRDLFIIIINNYSIKIKDLRK